MVSHPSVGVAVATYNQGAYLKECLQSIASQSYPVSQIVICDDCSSDNTPEVIAAFVAESSCPVEVIGFKRNIGSPAKTFNAALARLSTDYVALLCGDDLWPGDKLEKELYALAREPKARFAYCGMLSIDEHGRALGDVTMRTQPMDGDILVPTLARENRIDWLAERSLFEEVGFYDENIRATTDWDFNIRLASKGQAVFVPDLLFYYRQHQGSITRRADPAAMLAAHAYVYRKHARLIAGLSLREKMRVWRRKYRKLYAAHHGLGHRSRARGYLILWKLLERIAPTPQADQ